MAPTNENSQKAGLGRSPPRRMPKAAVATGRSPDEYDRMRRSHVLKRQSCQQRKADDDAQSDNGERAQIIAARSRALEREQQSRAEQRGDDCARRRQEQRCEAADRDPRSRQRSAEYDHPEEAAAPSVRRAAHIPSCCPRKR
jgi:hypothetical protein